MTRIVKCADFDCPSRGHCWRFMVPAEPEQDFSDFGATRYGKKCKDYINGDQQRRTWRGSQASGASNRAPSASNSSKGRLVKA